MSENGENGGVGFLGLLTILFIGLKLTGHISWSWWWVFAPIWGTMALLLGVFVLTVIVAILFEICRQK